MIRGDSPEYDSYRDFGTAQVDANWEWIDGQLRSFAEMHDGMIWGRTAFDGVVHAVQWSDDGVEKQLRLMPRTGGDIQVEIVATFADSDHGWHVRSESREFSMKQFRKVVEETMDDMYAECAMWRREDVPEVRKLDSRWSV